MWWRLIFKEFDPELKYIKGEEICDNQDILNISEIYGYDDADLPDSAYPIHYHDISKAQKTDDKLQKKLVSHKDYTLNNYRGGDQNHCLIWRLGQILAALEMPVVLCDKLRGRQTWWRLGCLTMDRCQQC